MIEIKEFKAFGDHQISQDVLDILHDAFKHDKIELSLARNRAKSRYLCNNHTFGIYLDGQLIGTASVLVETKLFKKEKSNIAHIEDVAIHRDYRGFGYGQQLINHLVDYAKIKGCYKVVLYCSNDNRAFYKKCGFRHTSNLMRKDLD